MRFPRIRRRGGAVVDMWSELPRYITHVRTKQRPFFDLFSRPFLCGIYYVQGAPCTQNSCLKRESLLSLLWKMRTNFCITLCTRLERKTISHDNGTGRIRIMENKNGPTQKILFPEKRLPFSAGGIFLHTHGQRTFLLPSSSSSTHLLGLITHLNRPGHFARRIPGAEIPPMR